MKKRGKNNSAQVTIFIIIGLLIVSSILIYFLLVKPKYISTSGSLSFENCMENAVKDSLAEISMQAGFYQPKFFYLYQNNKIGYLCYTNLFYKPCVNQVPFIKDHLEQQLTSASREKVFACFDSSLSELRRRGYEVSGDKKNLSISLNPGNILVELDAPVTMVREGSSSFNKFKTTIKSPIYELVMVATSIVQQETKYGDSDTDSLTLFYPELGISKVRREDGTNIYSIENRDTKTKFQFAVRSFAWPAGYGYDQRDLMMEGDKG